MLTDEQIAGLDRLPLFANEPGVGLVLNRNTIRTWAAPLIAAARAEAFAQAARQYQQVVTDSFRSGREVGRQDLRHGSLWRIQAAQRVLERMDPALPDKQILQDALEAIRLAIEA